MKVQHKEGTEEFLELRNKINYFTKLKPEVEKDSLSSVSLKVSSYRELNMMVSDLLKASVFILKNDRPGLMNPESKDEINVLTLLEIALQLLPDEEMELLDELHKA